MVRENNGEQKQRLAKVLQCNFSKIRHFEVTGGPSDAEFGTDYDYDGPQPLGTPNIGVFEV